MTARETCSECGAAIALDSPGGFCIECLLKLGLGEVESAKCGVQNKEAAKEPQNSERSVRNGGKKQAQPEEGRTGRLLTDEPNDTIGRYRLLQEIGHGGCGVVYLAEQEEPVQRRIALKVIKLGMDTRQVVARFEAERQAVALMDHPNIAKVLDAGATASGRPYFVMELVDGIKITDYCDQHQLTVRHRLGLFIDVCRAIQHAHQKGVIHRDIKPSNVLVATQDGVPVPKVIDFGIAKATQGRLTDQTVFTAVEQFIGTPAYMSPEQAQLGSLDVDSRSDIYSLGVLLYELLTGKTPFDTQAMMAGGIDEIRRTIIEKEPVTPSTRLKHDFAVQQVEARDKFKMQNPKSKIEKDLDWIVMKCLEKDRGRRYETANGLARDIERCLDNEPITARPRSQGYRLQKFFRRNKLLVTASCAVLFVLLSGLAGVISQWRRAEQFATLERNDRSRAQSALTQMEAVQVRRAEEYFQAGDRRNMLTYLALVLRQNPSNRIAAERLFSTLSHRNWARLACAPLMHSNRVTSAMFSQDGRHVVTSCIDGTAWVWDARTGERIAGPLRHNAAINAAEFSPDGLLVATVSDDHTVRVWDARTGLPVTDPIPHPETVELARFSPDSQAIVTLCNDRVARLWDARSGRSLHSLPQSPGLPMASFFRDCDFSPDGKLLAIAGLDEYGVRVWNCQEGTIAYNLEPGGGEGFGVHFSPNGRLLGAALGTNGAAVWNLASNPPQLLILPHAGKVRDVQFSSDGSRIISSSSNGTSQVWDTLNGNPVGPLLRHRDGIQCATFSPEGLRLATASADRTIRVWSAEAGEEVTEPMRLEHGAYYAQFHPDGQRVLTASNGRAVLIWWVNGATSMGLYSPNHAAAFEFNTDGTKLLVGSAEGWCQIWEPLLDRAPLTLSQQAGRVASVAFSRDGTYAGTSNWDRTARVWAVATGLPVTGPLDMRQFGDQYSRVEFDPSGKRLLVTVERGMARVWDVAGGRPASTALGQEGAIIAAQFSPDGKWIATAETNGSARIWDSSTGLPVGTSMRHDGPVLAVRFSPDGRRLLTGSADNTARLWSVPNGEPIGSPLPHGLAVWHVRFSPEGNRFLTAVPDHPSVRVWDSVTGKLLTEILADNAIVAEFTPDGRRIVTESDFGERACKVWDSETGERLSETLLEHAAPRTLRVSPEGRYVAACVDGTVRLSDVTPPPLPVPAWLPELAEALAGQRVNQQGIVEPVFPWELWTVQKKMTAFGSGENQQNLPRHKAASFAAAAAVLDSQSRGVAQADSGLLSADFWQRWAAWFLSPPPMRTVLPSASVTIARYAELVMQNSGKAAASREALLLQPTNGSAMADFALASTNPMHAEWLSQRAMEQVSLWPGILWARESFLNRHGRFEEALSLFKEYPSLCDRNPWLRADKAEILQKMGRLKEAFDAYSDAISVARPDDPRSRDYDRRKALLHNLLLNRCRVLKQLNRPAEAQTDLLQAEHIPARAPSSPGSRFISTDLRPFLNQGLQDMGLTTVLGATNSTAPLRTLVGVEFELCGYIILDDKGSDPLFPSSVLKITIGHRARALHFLHSSAPGTNILTGFEVGSYVVHYAEAPDEVIPIVGTQDVRWWFDPDKELGPLAVEAWNEKNDNGRSVRLFKRSWTNPHPESEIRSIDFLAGGPHSSRPMLFAITAER